MPANNNCKKMDECKQKVINFLCNHRYNDDMEDKPTHQSWGNVIKGRFYINSEDGKEFMAMYNDAIENNVTDFSILEMQKEYSPIIVDIDLKIPTDDYQNKRLYDNNLINNIIKKFLNAFDKYIEFDKTNFKICVFEKKSVTKLDDICKDGFHLIFPDICANVITRHLIRQYVVNLCTDENIFETFLETPDKIIDKAVVSSNGWFLYGSKKPGGQMYKLSQVYNYNLEKIELNGNLVIFFSLHYKKKRYSKKTSNKLKLNYEDIDIHAEIDRLNINTFKSDGNKYELSEDLETLVKRACTFISMLDENRAANYEEWRNVGLALHNTHESLLPTWLEFSSKCTEKYNEGACYKFWKQFKNPLSGNLLTIRSLAYWAKLDNPKEYEIFIHNEFKKSREESLDGSTYKIAKSFHAKYSDKFACSSAKSNLWWEFKNHRWNRIEDAYSIKILLSEEFQNDYRADIIDLNIRATKSSGIEKDQIQARISAVNKIIERLMNIDFKKKIIEEAKSLFLEPKFDEKLDSNINIIGFENGVYDLEQNIFRDGHPDDFISLSTKNNYIKFSENMPYYKQIVKFFSEVLPNEKVRKYFIQALCTCLSGDTKEEKLYILTGSGSNGKSLTMDLMYASLGDYYMSCPITIITRKRGQSNETSPEKVRMRGKRCGVFQETDDGDKINVGVMKEFTGGDKVLVRDLFKGANEMIEFKPQMKYFLTCNQLPEVPSNDDGTWRRLRVIEFGSRFIDSPDPNKSNEFKINTSMKQNIQNWTSTFVSYLIHIYKNEYKGINYLKEPEEVMASTNQYKLQNDYYTEYCLDRLTITNDPKNKIQKVAKNKMVQRDGQWP